MAPTKAQEKAILRAYFDPKFPASYQGVEPFRESLLRNKNIDISRPHLRRLLKSNLYFQTNIIKPKKFPTRKFYSRGVGIEGYCDTVFLKLPQEKLKETGKKGVFIFLLVADTHSRYLYTTPCDQVNPTKLKAAFNRLFKDQDMPYFSVLRVDRDKSLNTLVRYFAGRDMLLRARRSVHHMGFLEGIIKTLKKRFILLAKKNPPRGGKWSSRALEKTLSELTKGYNSTVSTSHGLTPESCNSPIYDPLLRERLYPRRKLEPFADYVHEVLDRQTKANTPRPPDAKRIYDERRDSFKKNDLVYIDFDKSKAGGQYKTAQRGRLLRVERVNTLQRPYVYKLRDHQNNPLHGWYYGNELARGDLSDLTVDGPPLKTKWSTDKPRRKLIYVKFKGYDDSFNRWIEEGGHGN